MSDSAEFDAAVTPQVYAPPTKRKEPIMVTPAHMVFHHGYTREYAAKLSPEQREAEHQRLHEDETAKHLDHRHEDRVVMLDRR